MPSSSTQYGVNRLTERGGGGARRLTAKVPRTVSEPSITPATLVTVAPYRSLVEGLTARVESGKRFGEDTAEQRIYEAVLVELARATEEARRACQ